MDRGLSTQACWAHSTSLRTARDMWPSRWFGGPQVKAVTSGPASSLRALDPLLVQMAPGFRAALQLEGTLVGTLGCGCTLVALVSLTLAVRRHPARAHHTPPGLRSNLPEVLRVFGELKGGAAERLGLPPSDAGTAAAMGTHAAQQEDGAHLAEGRRGRTGC